MDNAQKAIMIGVGLFITIIVIAAVMLITGVGQDLLNSGTQQLNGISDSLRQQVTDQYDEKIMTQSQVRAACIDLKNKDASIVVKVANGDTTNIISAPTDEKIPKNGTKKYKGSVTYDSNTGIATVTFTLNSTTKKD